MSFLTILRKDLNVFIRCVNYQLLHGSKIKNSRTQCVTSHVRRSYSDEYERIPRPLGEKTITRLRQFDNVPKDYELIYRAPRSAYYLLGHSTLLITGIGVPVMFYSIAERHNFSFPIRINDWFVFKDVTQFYIGLGFIAVILGMLFKVITRYPLRLYRKKLTDEYIAAYPNFFLPWKMAQLKFKKGDMTSADVPDYIPIQLSNFEIQGHKVIIFEKYFLRPADLEYMMATNQKIE